MDSLAELELLLPRLVSARCWKVAAPGVAFGSHFTLDFGDKLEWKLTSEQLDLMRSGYYGEYGIQVKCAVWRLEDQQTTITTSADDPSLGGPMIEGLHLLQDRRVTSAQITRPELNLLIEFDETLLLSIFHDESEEFESYSVSYRDAHFCVGAHSQVILRQGDDPA
jgi:hypothetical protein